jgi:uncharacterized protein HemX
MANIENSGVSIKTLAGVFLLFVNLAFGLIGYIYAQGQTVNQDKVIKLEGRVTDLEKTVTAQQNTLTQYDGRLSRQDERTQDNSNALQDLNKRQADTEKILILSNARFK